MAIHEATRRELLTGSGALFAWAFVPKIARAEGRDPRFLTIILPGESGEKINPQRDLPSSRRPNWQPCGGRAGNLSFRTILVGSGSGPCA